MLDTPWSQLSSKKAQQNYNKIVEPTWPKTEQNGVEAIALAGYSFTFVKLESRVCFGQRKEVVVPLGVVAGRWQLERLC